MRWKGGKEGRKSYKEKRGKKMKLRDKEMEEEAGGGGEEEGERGKIGRQKRVER